MVSMLRTAEAEEGVNDTGGSKAGVGDVGAGHVMSVFLLATASAFVIAELSQGSYTHRVTGFLAAGDAIFVVVGRPIKRGSIDFDGNARVFIISIIVGSVAIEALAVMMSLATGLDTDDDKIVAYFGFNVVDATAVATFIDFPFNAMFTSEPHKRWKNPCRRFCSCRCFCFCCHSSDVVSRIFIMIYIIT